MDCPEKNFVSLNVTKCLTSNDTDLVDGVVSQVDVVVPQVLHLVGVGPGGEPHEAILEDVEPQRLDAGHQDIDPDVKLEAVNQKRSVDVLLDNHFAILLRNII